MYAVHRGHWLYGCGVDRIEVENLEWFGLTDRGKIRLTNQDVYQITVRENEEAALLVVCDGMGGANAGNVASRFAAEAFTKIIEPRLEEELDAETRRELLYKGLAEANGTVFDMAVKQPEFRGMGTTLVAALIKGDNATIINVGDSRAYLLSENGFGQITEDHSYVEEMYRLGRITKEDARRHPQRNLITRAVGVEHLVKGDIFELELKQHDVLLLCSDGLTSMAEDEQISEAISRRESLEQAGRELLNMALEGGGRDNITVALFTQGAGKGA